jgi:DNA-binding response OmpR family regulator
MKSNCCVLLVEDDQDIREVIADILQAQGYQVVVAENGAEGLRAIERSRPCLVLLDLMMSEINGWEFIDRVKAQSTELDICIVTASPALAPTGLPVLAKPLDLDRLLDTVARHCLRASP